MADDEPAPKRVERVAFRDLHPAAKVFTVLLGILVALLILGAIAEVAGWAVGALLAVIDPPDRCATLTRWTPPG